jgi:hypothetical protein
MKHHAFFRSTTFGAIALLAVCTCWQSALAAPPASSKARGNADALRVVRTLYIRDWRGDRIFKRNLQREMRAMGFVFTADKTSAQAFVSARGDGARGDFTGELWIYNRAGKTLWHERVYRPRNSNRMAYISLAGKLRAALKR